jgi:3-isopropylmalate dehydrogenase
MVLRHSAHLEQEALAIEKAVNAVLAAGHRTADIAKGGATANTSTTQMGQYVLDELAKQLATT